MKTKIDDLLTASTTEVLEYCTRELLKYYPKKDGEARVFIHDDDFAYAVGDNPICVVSHVDTVRDRQTSGTRVSVGGEKPVVLSVNRNVVTNKNGILGADDRAGVFACLDLVRRAHREKLPMPSVIFCNGEESGGLGVGVFVRTEAFKRRDGGRTKLFVEMDRCNSNDFVSYNGRLPQPVIDYVESFGFKSSNGSYSDIKDLSDAYLIPSVNVSIGYYGQHTANERLHLDEMYMTINRVHNMLRDPIAELHQITKYVYTPTKYTSPNYGNSNYNSRSTYKDSDFDKVHGGSKNANGGRGNASASNSFPPDNAGRRDYFDLLLDEITYGGYCQDCGYSFADCTCGEMIKQLLLKLDDEELAEFMKVYLTKDDPLYEMLEEYLDAVADVTAPDAEKKDEDKKDDAADPFHVAAEGEPVPAQLALTTTGGTPITGE